MLIQKERLFGLVALAAAFGVLEAMPSEAGTDNTSGTVDLDRYMAEANGCCYPEHEDWCCCCHCPKDDEEETGEEEDVEGVNAPIGFGEERVDAINKAQKVVDDARDALLDAMTDPTKDVGKALQHFRDAQDNLAKATQQAWSDWTARGGMGADFRGVDGDFAKAQDYHSASDTVKSLQVKGENIRDALNRTELTPSDPRYTRLQQAQSDIQSRLADLRSRLRELEQAVPSSLRDADPSALSRMQRQATNFAQVTTKIENAANAVSQISDAYILGRSLGDPMGEQDLPIDRAFDAAGHWAGRVQKAITIKRVLADPKSSVQDIYNLGTDALNYLARRLSSVSTYFIDGFERAQAMSDSIFQFHKTVIPSLQDAVEGFILNDKSLIEKGTRGLRQSTDGWRRDFSKDQLGSTHWIVRPFLNGMDLDDTQRNER